MDFVVFLNPSDIQEFHRVFPAGEFYLPSSDVIALECRREMRGHFNIIHVESGFKADLYLTGNDPLNAWALRGHREVQFEGERVRLAPPEYVIVRKLEYYREGHSEKHLRDIRAILSLSGDQLDKAALSEWIHRLGLQPKWRLVS